MQPTDPSWNQQQLDLVRQLLDATPSRESEITPEMFKAAQTALTDSGQTDPRFDVLANEERFSPQALAKLTNMIADPSSARPPVAVPDVPTIGVEYNEEDGGE